MRPESLTQNYHYEAIQIVVDRAGIYDIMSLSDMNTVGFLYESTFDPSNPYWHLYKNYDERENNQFKLTAYIEVNVPYTLVVSTFEPRTTGSFLVVATGPGNVQYIPIDSTVTSTSELSSVFFDE